MTTKSRGFTLVELLVVVAIILVLAALSFSFAKRGIEAAYAGRCMNNLKNIVNTHMGMTADHNGNFIHPNLSKMYGTGARGWAMHFTAALHPDVDARKWSDVNDRVEQLDMFNCPSAYAKHKTEMGDVEGHGRWRTYGINTRIGHVDGQYNAGGGDNRGGWVTGATRPDQVEDPSMLVMAADTTWNNRQYRNAFGPFNVRDNNLADHHNGGFHAAFMDGHVEHYTIREFPYPDNTLPDGREMKWRESNPRTPEEIYLSLFWRGTTFKRSMPSSP